MSFTATLKAVKRMADEYLQQRPAQAGGDKANGPAVIDSLKAPLRVVPVEPDGSSEGMRSLLIKRERFPSIISPVDHRDG